MQGLALYAVVDEALLFDVLDTGWSLDEHNWATASRH
jgi:hypothetical protein